MTHKFEALLYAVLFTFWCVRIYYKIYDKRTRIYILAIGILMVIWMMISVSYRAVSNINVERYLWYSYFIALIFIPTIFYNYCDSLSNKKHKLKKIIIYTISSILLIFVYTNDYHNLVYIFNRGLNNYTYYSYGHGYYLVTIWIFFLLISALIRLVINKVRIKKDIKALIPIILLLLGVIYTTLYILQVDIIKYTNMAIVYSLLICLGIESAFYINLIPNNKKYINTFSNSHLDMGIVSLDGNTYVCTKSFKLVPKYIKEDIINNNLKYLYTSGNINYEIKKNNTSIVIIKKDLTELNNLKKEIDNKKELLLKQYNSMLIEEKTKKELYSIKIRKEVVNKIENKLNEKIQVAKDILNKSVLLESDLNDIKKIIIYCKKKSQLMISEINEEVYDEENIKVLLNDLVTSMSNINSIVIVSNKMIISGFDMSNIYDIIYEVIDLIKDKNMVIYISLNNDKLELKVTIDSYIKIKDNIKLDKIVDIKESHYDNDTIVTFTRKEGV